MREILEKYPEILFIDGTYKVNIEGYILYSILVEDGGGRGRPVCYAFLQNETTEIVEAMFAKFAEFNPFIVSACRVVMIDKDMNELRILTKILPNSEILLCTWHVLHSDMFISECKLQILFNPLYFTCVFSLLYRSTDVPAACIHTTIKSSGASVPLSKYYTIV